MSAAIDLTQWIRAGDTVCWGQSCAQPLALSKALVEQRHRIGRTRLFLGAGLSASLPGPEHADAFDFLGYGGAGTTRALAKAGVLDVLPCHYSELPRLIRSERLRIDVLLLQVSMPDERGRYSLGHANEYLLAALDAARVVIAEANPSVPWTHGERTLEAEGFDALIVSDEAMLDQPTAGAGPVEVAIGRHVAGLVEDGSTLQLGIGAVPEAVLAALDGHRNLGIHSGSIGDGVAVLTELGVIDNTRKSIDTGVTVAGVLMGGDRLRRHAHRNPNLKLRSTDYTHDERVLARHDRFVSINSAIEVDLTGQINAEVAGSVYVGAVGGALDFGRAAHRSRGGLPICALPATAGSRSRIVARLSGPVSTPRCDAGIVVTEYGVADLRGRTLAQRRRLMLEICAPQHRAALEALDAVPSASV